MKNTTITENIVVRQYWDEDGKKVSSQTNFAFIEDAERVFNFNSKTIRVFKVKTTVEEEEIPTESKD